MAESKLSELLPIDGSVANPNAYQVFGLHGGGHDDATVGRAIKRVYARLKQTKPTADPNVWKRAAQLAESARKVLEDPDRRQQLDQTLVAAGSATDSGSAKTAEEPRAVATEDDPLAGLLPPVDPLAGAKPLPPSTQKNAAVLGVPPGVSPAASVLGTPPTPAPQSADQPPPIQGTSTTQQVAAGVQPAAAPQTAATPTPAFVAEGQPRSAGWSPTKSGRKKRRKKNTGMLWFGAFVVAMLGGIVGLLHFLNQGGRIAINTSPEQGVMVAQPMQPPAGPAGNSRRGGDDVLPAAPASGVTETLRRRQEDRANGSGLSQADPLNNPQPAMEPSAPMQPPTSPNPMPAEPDPEPQPEPAPMTEPPTSEPEPMKPTTPEPDPETVAANRAKIEAVESLIQSAAWDRIKPAASELLKLELSAEQAARASSLYDIADLAVYYRGAIERGLASLETGNEFAYVDNIKMIVVEATPKSVTLRYNRRDKSFTIDELPPRLTESLAALTLPMDKPDTIAAQALYRLIHPATNDAYRDDAFESLASVDGQLEQVDTKELQTVAQELLSQ
jgi:hypothetical protein